jgi:hypothetical protein
VWARDQLSSLTFSKGRQIALAVHSDKRRCKIFDLASEEDSEEEENEDVEMV